VVLPARARKKHPPLSYQTLQRLQEGVLPARARSRLERRSSGQTHGRRRLKAGAKSSHRRIASSVCRLTAGLPSSHRIIISSSQHQVFSSKSVKCLSVPRGQQSPSAWEPTYEPTNGPGSAARDSFLPKSAKPTLENPAKAT
jgi:hypothetical protein